MYSTSLTQTANQPLGSNAWHNVRVLLGASILLWFQHAVGILQQEVKENQQMRGVSKCELCVEDYLSML